ncbi:hypothetical protein KS03_143 [Burkholderia glumae LMG 2196 = ATCC 33617]|nr:hypothetical protein KS03_143 [Burkholderia glumae LMG 2196 = ATCC 33617]
MPNSRHKRYSAFQEFLNSAPTTFEALCDLNPTAKRLNDIYSLCVTPGGRLGGNNRRQFEVFFGARPYDEHEGFDRSFRPTMKLLAEQGATLEFVRDDLGRVHVTLYPATSEGMKPLEDALELGVVDDAAEFAKDTILARYFRVLIAYMQCTCLDGLPTMWDRWTVAKLRFLHRRSVDGRMHDSRISIAAREIVKWGFTVGFSGVLLATVQWVFSRGQPTIVEVSAEPPHTQQQRADLISQGKESAKRLDAIERSLRDIRVRLDAPLVAEPVPSPFAKKIAADRDLRNTAK